jgi:lipid-A-disaccharide synthase
MTKTTREIMIIAGEVSGDIHAANLLTALRDINPESRAFGIGGERLEAAGLRLIGKTDELAHMGLVEVIREVPRIRRLMQRTVAAARHARPSVAVLVDSPDFNLRLAKQLKRLGVKVVLYVSPQLWAWRRGRVRIVRRLAEEVLCILPFEVDFYTQHGVKARYVGHPLVDDIAAEGLLRGSPVRKRSRLALLPGSRAMEVRSLLPTMLSAARNVVPRLVDEIVLIEAPGVQDVVASVLSESDAGDLVIRVRGKDRRQELARATLAWTASGTATLECALLDVPMVVGYRLQTVSYALARLLVRVPHVALVNLIAQQRVAPELIQGDWNPDRLVSESARLLAADRENSQQKELRVVRERLGPAGASVNASRAVLEATVD